MTVRMGVARFKSLVRQGAIERGAQVNVSKTTSITIEAGNADRRKLFTISTDSVDRQNDTLAIKGWKLDAFVKSPLVFYNHETYGYAIGKAVEIGVEGNALKSMVEFMPSHYCDGAGEKAESCFQQVEGGFLCSASVGFRPLEYKTAKDRMDDDDWWPALDFLEQELMEWSVVGIPANAEATIDDDERAAVAELQKQWRGEWEMKQEQARKAAESLAAEWKAIRTRAYCYA